MKLKKGDKVYFTKESAPNFQETYLTYGKKYEVLDIDGGLYVIEDDNGETTITNIYSIGHLNGGTWLKVKTKKRKLEKEIEQLIGELELTTKLLKESRELFENLTQTIKHN